MNEGKREELISRKRKLLLRLQVDDLIKYTINDYLYIFDFLNNNKVLYDIEYLACASEELYSTFLTALRDTNLRSYHFNNQVIKLADNHYVHEKVEHIFPSSLQLRYLPQLPNYEKTFGLRSEAFLKAVNSLGLSDETVYFFYCKYSPVIKLKLNDLQQHITAFLDTEMVANDVCIVPLDYRWLIFGSIEDDWGWGFKSVS